MKNYRPYIRPPKFYIVIDGKYWNKNEPSVLGRWVDTPQEATPASLRISRIYLKDWFRYHPQAILAN